MPKEATFSLDAILGATVFKTNPKLLYKLKLNTSEDSFYEAHQLYKTLHFRCLTANNFQEACDIIYNGIVFFYERVNADNVYYCTDLSKVFIETLKKLPDQTPALVDTELLERVKVIHMALRNASEERNEFACTILKWSGSLFSSASTNLKETPAQQQQQQSTSEEQNNRTYQKTFGHFDIHRQFAHNFWADANFVQARYHFLHSQDGASCAKMLVECHLNYGYPSESDLFLTQTVLQYLCLRNLRAAREFHDNYVKSHPGLSTTKQHYPLLNFLKFLFVSIQHDQVKWFKALLDVYKPSLEVDPSFGDYLERIGQYFFNLKPKQVEKGSMFSNIFKMLTNPGPSDSNGARPNPLGALLAPNGLNNQSANDDSEEIGLDEDDLLD